MRDPSRFPRISSASRLAACGVSMRAMNETRGPGMKSTRARLCRPDGYERARIVRTTTAAPGESAVAHDQDQVVPAPFDSGVYVAARKDPKDLWEQVTLVVYGWHNVQPGTLSWVFPSVTAAIDAARAMKNAIRWAILAGHQSAANVDVETERMRGMVLCEQRF